MTFVSSRLHKCPMSSSLWAYTGIWRSDGVKCASCAGGVKVPAQAACLVLNAWCSQPFRHSCIAAFGRYSSLGDIEYNTNRT